MNQLVKAYDQGQEAHYRHAVDGRGSRNPFREKRLAIAWQRGFNGEALEEYEIVSCATKKRFDYCPQTYGGMTAYACGYCGGWHRATRR